MAKDHRVPEAPDEPEYEVPPYLGPIEDVLVDLWLRALEEAWRLAKGSRAQELRGRYAKGFDERGMHPYSRAWGRVHAVEEVLPWLQQVREGSGAATCDALVLRNLAAAAAQEDFAQELLAHGTEVFA